MEPVARYRSLPKVSTLLRYHYLAVIVAVGVALGLATLYVVKVPSTYTAAAVVLLSPAPGNPLTAEASSSSSLQMTVALQTETQLVGTPAVFDLVSKSLGRPVPGADESVDVSVPSNTQMLEVSFTSTTPERAREGSQALAEAYLQYRAQRAGAVQEARVTQLNEQIADTDADLKRAVAIAGISPYAAQEVVLFVDRLATLKNSLSATELVSTYPGSIVSAAELPDRAKGLPDWALLGAAGLLGLVAGGALALWREWKRNLIRDADIGVELGLPVFATIPQTAFPVLAPTAGPGVHESYRQLRTAVIANAPRPHTLAVTTVGVKNHDEASMLSAEVAANLAVVLAEAKLSVLLVTTQLSQDPVEELLGVESAHDLVDVVLGNVTAHESLVRTHGIAVLTSGPEAGGFPDLTAAAGFGMTINEMRQEFDYVVLAAAPTGSADGDAVLLVADSALLVCKPDITTRTQFSDALDHVDHLGVKMVGAARVRPGRRRGSRPTDRDRGTRPPAHAAEAAWGNGQEDSRSTG